MLNMTSKAKKISVVIPVLNESKNIAKLIASLKNYLRPYSYEIIFVDDNSTDGTKDVILKYTSTNLRYYLRKKNKDLTLSCFLGIKKSVYDNIIIMDADLQHNPYYLPKMINLFFNRNLDFVVAVRDFNDKQGIGFFRIFLSKVISYIFIFFLGYKVSDPMSGFFMFKKCVYYKYRSTLFGRGWKILADLIYNKHFFSIFEFKIKFLKRKNNHSKMNYKVLNNIILLFFYKFFYLKIK